MSLVFRLNGVDRSSYIRIGSFNYDAQLNGLQSMRLEFLDTSGLLRPDLANDVTLAENERTFTASISASSAALTGSGFSIADIGRVIVVSGAGPSGADLTSKVIGFSNSTHVTLEFAASTTVSSVTARIEDRKFGGRITDTEEMPFFADNGIQMTLTIADYNEFPTIEPINAGFSGQTLKQIVTYIVTNVLATHGTRVDPAMASGPIVPDVGFDFAYIDAAFNQLSDFTGYVWYVDNTNTLRWFLPGGLSATTLDSSIPLNDPLCKITKSWGDYRNVQWLKIGDNSQRMLDEFFQGDGVTRSWQIAAVPVNNPPQGSVRVTRAGPVVTDYVLGVFGGPELWTYHDTGTGGRTIDQNVSDPVLGVGETVELLYLAQYPIAIVRSNNTEVTARGRRVKVDQAPNITDLQAGYDYADALLRRYSFVPRKISFETYNKNFFQGFLYDVNLPNRGISHVTFMVDQFSTNDDGAGTPKYTVGMIEGSEFQQLWQEWFRGASSSGGAGSISTGTSPPTTGTGGAGTAILRGFLGGLDGGFVVMTSAGTWYDINNRVDLSLQSTLFPTGSTFFVRVHVKLFGGAGTPHIQCRLWNQTLGGGTSAGVGTNLANPTVYTYDGFFVTLDPTECIYNLQFKCDQSGVRGYVQFATIESR